MSESVAEFAAFAESLLIESRRIVLDHWRQDLDVIDKADESPVTVADRAVEAMIRERIEAKYPEHGIAGEEFGRVRLDAEYVWSLDPIDGTKAFISGSPLFGTLIALLRGGVPVLGVVDVPATGEVWIGGEGLPTTHYGQAVCTRVGWKFSEATCA